jgi:hypothetical protein
VYRILSDGCSGKTLSLLPGTENLSSITRGLLVRLGYRSVDAVLTGLARGRLYVGCIYGMGAGRFSEITAWAREFEVSSKPTTPSRRRSTASPRVRTAPHTNR